jgi:hypothetical protein
MINHKLLKKVADLSQDLVEFGDLVAEQGAEHIVAGYTVDKASSGQYISFCFVPLYDYDENVLRFSDRLPSGAEFIKSGCSKELALEFLGKISPFRQSVRSMKNLDMFAEYLSRERFRGHGFSSIDPLIVPSNRRAYIATLIMLGRCEEAEYHSKILLAQSNVPLCDLERVSAYLEALRSGDESAFSLLSTQERDARTKLEGHRR